MTIFFLHADLLSYSEPVEQRAWTSIDRSFKVLESFVANRTFVVGESLTLADITLASTLNMLLTKFVGADWREKYPNTVRYFNAMREQGPIAETFPKDALLEETVKYQPK